MRSAKKIVNLTVIIACACLMIALCTGSVTTYSSEHAVEKCALCGKPSDSHGGAVTVEKESKHQISIVRVVLINMKKNIMTNHIIKIAASQRRSP